MTDDPIRGTFFATPPKGMKCSSCGDALSIVSGCDRGRGEFYTHSPFSPRTDPGCLHPTAATSDAVRGEVPS